MTQHVSSNISIVAFLDKEFDYTKDGKVLEQKLSEIENVNNISFKYFES